MVLILLTPDAVYLEALYYRLQSRFWVDASSWVLEPLGLVGSCSVSRGAFPTYDSDMNLQHMEPPDQEIILFSLRCSMGVSY